MVKTVGNKKFVQVILYLVETARCVLKYAGGTRNQQSYCGDAVRWLCDRTTMTMLNTCPSMIRIRRCRPLSCPIFDTPIKQVLVVVVHDVGTPPPKEQTSHIMRRKSTVNATKITTSRTRRRVGNQAMRDCPYGPPEPPPFAPSWTSRRDEGLFTAE